MKKIGLLSDTHGYIDDRIIHHFKDVDEIWHAGDIGGLHVTDELAKHKMLRAVYGNIDDAKARATFPEHARFMCEQVPVWMTHIGGRPYAYPKNIRYQLQKNTPKLFICGHSHILRVQFDKRLGMLYMNPGACGRKGFHKERTLLRFAVDKDRIKDLEIIELGSRTTNGSDPESEQVSHP